MASKKWGVLLDLDQTLVITDAIEPLRRQRAWFKVYNSFDQTVLPPGTTDFLFQSGRACNGGRCDDIATHIRGTLISKVQLRALLESVGSVPSNFPNHGELNRAVPRVFFIGVDKIVEPRSQNETGDTRVFCCNHGCDHGSATSAINENRVLLHDVHASKMVDNLESRLL